ncbi:MAG TPA: hypothetical protein VNE82_16255 [Candidatus Binataceae bacterium]|nr:hypothetical protein [Candidatus Binataceae bacterium]
MLEIASASTLTQRRDRIEDIRALLEFNRKHYRNVIGIVPGSLWLASARAVQKQRSHSRLRELAPQSPAFLCNTNDRPQRD